MTINPATKQLGAILMATLISISLPIKADQPLLARTAYPFDQAISEAKQQLTAKGYTVVHTQKCDNALGHYEYATDSYRVLLFSKLSFARDWIQKYPALAGFLPLRLAVYAENDHTMLASYNPDDLYAKVQIPELEAFFSEWAGDIKTIMQTMQATKPESASDQDPK